MICCCSLEDDRSARNRVDNGVAGYIVSITIKADMLYCLQDDENPPEFPVPEGDRSALKAGIVQVMIQLSNSPNIQVQVGEAIAVMAEWDFPLQWGDLVNVCPLHLPAIHFRIIADRLHTINHTATHLQLLD